MEKGYNTVFNGVGTRVSSASIGIQASYKDNVFDEFIEPIVVGDYTGVKDGDSVIFYNSNKVVENENEKYSIESYINCKEYTSKDYNDYLIK